MDAIVNHQDELTMRILQGEVVCNDLEVIDACRGTGLGDIYNKRYEPFYGECKQNRGNFVEGLPIYKSKTGGVFMYAIGVYPDHWSKVELRGLNMWRIASFQSFSDRTTCRIEEANIDQINFAAKGQPYNFFPTISCFDRFGDDSAGYKSSTINLRCNDFNVIGGGNDIPVDSTAEAQDPSGGGDDERSGGAKFGIALAILLILGGLAYGGFILYKKKKGNDSAGSIAELFSEDLESGKPLKDKNNPPESVPLKRESNQEEAREQAKKEEFQFLSRPWATKPKETKPETPAAILEKDTKEGKDFDKSKLPPAFQFLSRPWETKPKDTKSKPPAALLEKDIKEGKEDEKSKLPPAFQFLSRPNTTSNESVPKKIIPQKIVKEEKKEEPQLPPAFQFLSRPKITKTESKPVPEQVEPVPVAPTKKASSRPSVDPPAEEDDSDDDDDAIPSSIKNMVADLDSFFDDDDKPSGTKPWKKPTPRRRSFSPSPASKYAAKENNAPLNKRQAIDPSEHILKTRPGMGSRNGSFTPSNANKFDKQQANKSRPRSLSPSNASKFGKKSATPQPEVQISPTRSRSLEPSNAGKYGKPRPRSVERTPDPKNLSKPRGRWMEPTPDARNVPKTRTRSLEPTPDPKKLSRANSFEPTPGHKKLPTASPEPMKGKGSHLDASKLNTEITVNADGSVTITERKTRDDGAIVRTRTTYRDKEIAAKHGYDA
jgi:hypothetical protein